MTEAELQACVIDLAHVLNWRVAHFRPAQSAKGWRTAVAADGRGFPDLVLAKQGRVLFAELKASKGLTTDAQRKWLDELGPLATVWSPADWHGGEIQRVLSGVPAPKIEGSDFALALRIQTQASIPKLGEIHEIPEGSLGVVYREHLTMAEVQAIVSRFTANQALGSGGGLSQ